MVDLQTNCVIQVIVGSSSPFDSHYSIFIDEKERSTIAVDMGNKSTRIATVRSAGKRFAYLSW